MNPYLEAGHLWRSFHTDLLVEICRDLQPQIVPRYVARTEERVVLGPLEQGIVPDVNVREHGPPGSGGAAVAARPAAADVAVPECIEVPDLVVPERYVEIRDARSHQVVTVIEVLSPWNKAADGHAKYREKQEAVLLSDANLVEIDLLRRGLHTVAVPAALLRPSDYRVCLHRSQRTRFEVIRISIRDPLPNVAIPLRYGDQEPVLHLGLVFDRCFAGGAYEYDLDYSRPPDPPLAPEDAAWCRDLVEQWRAQGRDRPT